ncbi:hypothetical protein [Streptomyces gardneri]|uniref:hypothetical protein n=1 Tax=Streptomyces gardneri TaxID=66892 RepID=UPI0036AD2CB0
MYAVLYEIHNAHHRNRARPEEVCEIINQYGLAVFLRRCGAMLSPIEILTAHYATTHAHPAWRYRLVPMDATVLFRAVREDPRATMELVGKQTVQGIPTIGGMNDSHRAPPQSRCA